MLSIKPMFAIPFAFESHPSPVALNTALRKLFLQRENEAFEHKTPYIERNNAVFESRFDLFHWPDPEIAELREFCMSRAWELVRTLNGYELEAMQQWRTNVESWFHVTRRGGWFGIHNHRNASWSGVYCVDAGQPDQGSADNGKLSFVHPYAVGVMHTDVGNQALRPPFNLEHVGYRLNAGDLVLFPSHLLHQVTPFSGDGERITVAFNCTFMGA